MTVFLILSFLVLIHELGHFLAARRVGVKVEEFGFGYPPLLKKLFHWRGTDFTLNWLPFGGFVRLAGDDAESFEKALVPDADKTKETEKQHLFSNKSMAQRLFIVLAGATINVLFGVLAFSIIYTHIGIPTYLPHPLVEAVTENSPAQKAGFQIGDELVNVAGTEVSSSASFIQHVQQQRGKTIEIGIVRNNKQMNVSSYVRTLEETPAGEGSLGIVLNDFMYKHYAWWEMPIRGAAKGLQDSWDFAVMIPRVLGGVVGDLVTKRQVADEVSGPIGIVYTAEKQQISKQGWVTILNFAGLLSINLGVMNVLPIPALDGGRAAFILLEKIVGKRRRAVWEYRANNIGMIFLLGLIVLISIKDVLKIVAGQ